MLSTINFIKPNSLLFALNYGRADWLDFIKVLKELKNCANLRLESPTSTSWMFRFKNAIILVKSKTQDPIFIKWRDFVFYVKIYELNSTFWFTKQKSDSAENKDPTYFHLISSDVYEISDYEIIKNKEEFKFSLDESSDYLLREHEGWEFIIPIQYLNSVEVDESQAQVLLSNENWENIIKEISIAKKFSWTLKFANFLSNIDQYISIHKIQNLFI